MSDIQTWPNLTTSRGQSLSLRFAPGPVCSLSAKDLGPGWRQRRYQPKKQSQKPDKPFALNSSICLEESPRIWNKKGAWGTDLTSLQTAGALAQWKHSCVFSTDDSTPGSDWWEADQGRSSISAQQRQWDQCGWKRRGQWPRRQSCPEMATGNWPNSFTSHARPTLGSLESMAVGFVRGIDGAIATQTSKILVVYTAKSKGLLIQQKWHNLKDMFLG